MRTISTRGNAYLALVLLSCTENKNEITIPGPGSPEPVHDTQKVSDPYLVAPFDTNDGHNIRLYDLVISNATILRKLDELELEVVAGPKQDSDGNYIVAIRSTGISAQNLHSHGIVPSSHNDQFWRNEHIDKKFMAPCGPQDRTESGLFPDYDEYVQNLSNSYGNLVHTIGHSTGEWRDIPAIVLDPIYDPGTGEYDDEIDHNADPPLPNSHVGDSVPTFVLLGTYHAKEWVSLAVTMKIAEYLADLHSHTTPAPSDIELWNSLARSRVVIVPMVNPDGYQYTISTNRSHRKNLGSGNCTTGNPGVDLNRSHSPTYWMPSESYSDNDCDDLKRGEPTEGEIQAIEGLYADLANGVYGHKSHFISTISYHSYGGVTLYPTGIHDLGDEYALFKTHTNPDISVYRHLFGTAYDQMFKDYSSTTPSWMIGATDESILYTVGGDIKHFASYGPYPHLGVTMELTSKSIGFNIECEPNEVQIVNNTAQNQIDGIRRLMSQRRKLMSSSVHTSFITTELGEIGPPIIARESVSTDAFEDKSWIMVPRWKSGSLGSLSMTVESGGTALTVAMQPMANGIYYDLYGVPLEDLLGESCIPCEAYVHDDSNNSDATYGAPNCNGQCAAGAAPASSVAWGLGSFGSMSWAPIGTTNTNRYLTESSGSPLWYTQHCAFLYSVYGSPAQNIGRHLFLSSGQGSFSWPMTSGSTAPETRNYPRSRNDMVEVSPYALMGGSVPGGEFAVFAGTDNPNLEVINPITYCKKWDGRTSPSW